MEKGNFRTDWQWFEVFGKKCGDCGGIIDLPTGHPKSMDKCQCITIPIAGAQPPKF